MDRIFLYDAQGRILRTIGRRGEGPGEFQYLRHIDVGVGDTIYVVDGARRLVVYARNGAFVRSGRLPFPVDQIRVLPDGRLLAVADVRTPALAGLPLHLLDRNGDLMRSFGKQNVLTDPAYPGIMVRKVAVGRDGSLWSANRTVFEQWDAGGNLTYVAQRHTPLLPLDVRPVPVTDNLRDQAMGQEMSRSVMRSKPGSGLIGMQVDSLRGVWTVIVAGADDWDAKPLPPGAGVLTSPAARDQLLDSVIELLDFETGVPTASVRLSFGAWRMPAPGTLLRLRDADDHYVLEVWRLDVHEINTLQEQRND
jgi:hypothetical protein